MMRSAICVLSFAGVLALAGCGGGNSVPAPTNVEGPPAIGSKEALKARFQELAQSGEGGSALEGLDAEIKKHVPDPAVQASLLKDFHALNVSSDPAKNKVLSKRIADKL